jgi:hypothetical protein
MAGRNVRGERTNDLIIDDEGLGDPTIEGQIRNTGGDLKAFHGGSLKSLLSGTGLNDGSHRALDQLVHELAEDAHVELVGPPGPVTKVITWTDAGKTVKIREETINYSGGIVTSVSVQQYDGAGVAIVGEKLTSTINRTGAVVESIDEVLT